MRLDVADQYKGYHATELQKYDIILKYLKQNPEGATKIQLAHLIGASSNGINSYITNAESIGILLWESNKGVIGLFRDNSNLKNLLKDSK